MQRLVAGLMAGLLMAASVSASVSVAFSAPLSEKEARNTLFKGTKFNIQMLEKLPVKPEVLTSVEQIIAVLSSRQAVKALTASGLSFEYYGAIAIMPDQVVSFENLDKVMSISAKLHNPEAAAATAKAGCDALDGPACIVVALILPKGYKPRDFTLSQAATEMFHDNWRDGDGPKFLAFSATTGAWVIAKGVGADVAARERCNEKAAVSGVEDCKIGIAAE